MDAVLLEKLGGGHRVALQLSPFDRLAEYCTQQGEVPVRRCSAEALADCGVMLLYCTRVDIAQAAVAEFGDQVYAKFRLIVAVLRRRVGDLSGANGKYHASRTFLTLFVLDTYNASTRGIDEKFLSGPLPNIDRKRTKEIGGVSPVSIQTKTR